MATEVKLPDLGEGAEDATISRWLVKEGDEVGAGDVLMEVATDKVDTEVPSPAAGTVLKINHSEGSLVGMDDVLLVIGEAGEEVGDSAGGDQAATAEAEPQEAEADQAEEAEAEEVEADEAEAEAVDASENGHAVKASPVARRIAEDKGIALDSIPGTGPGGRITKDDVLSSTDSQEEEGQDEDKGRPPGGAREALPGEAADIAPLSVYRLAANYNINLAEIAAGRPLSTLTRYDVMSAIKSRESGEETTVEARFLAPAGTQAAEDAAQAEQQAAPAPGKEAQPSTARDSAKAAAKEQPAAQAEADTGEELVKHSRMRAAVAKNTVASIFTAPHVTTMWDVDMSGVLAHRKAHRGEFAKSGVNLTVTAYLVEAIVAGLKAVPAANATWTDEGVIIKRYYNIGMAVALPADEYGMGGLIVPVIKHVEDLNLQGIARAVNDYAEKARNNELRGDDLQGGTFTLSNYGTSGSRFQTPVIVQPQVGILGVGAIEKRPVVVSNGHPLEANTGDYMAYLPMTTLGFSYDHRVLDGATADAFCAAVKDALESYHG